MSLKSKIKNDFKTKYPEIHKDNNNLFIKFQTIIFASNFWQLFCAYLFVISLITIYSLYINFEFLKILKVNFDDNVKTFTSGVITLVSMNLFVTNLLFTHLKDERDDIQNIIDERVNFKFITYLGFSIIICILCLYFFSNTIYKQDIKSNILIFIFYSFVFYIFLLIKLYNNVFKFINKEQRLKIIRKELMLEFSRAYYNNFIKNEFKSRYENFILKEQSFERFPFFTDANITHIYISKNKVSFLNDINLDGLKKALDKINSEKKYFHNLNIDDEFPKKEEIKIYSFNNNINLKLSKYFSFAKNKRFEDKFEKQQLNKLLNKIDDNSTKNNSVALKSNLENLEEIYKKYIDLEG